MVMNAVDLTAAASADDVKGLRKALRKALRKGVNVNARGPQANATALHYAVRAGARNAIIVLIAAGADPNLQDLNGNTALWDSVSSTKSGPDVVKALIAAGADRNIRNKSGRSPLDYVNSVDGKDASIFDVES
ncbi:ankyrin repeat domain-containing protein [uncultured Schumannella sp.]|uniref:ankyrin repeat domain-containing protein n=1 Tax=uncultured Schumannella sp. TaxID=1195956 RepID=UPI0025F0836D|nr:ankyrin repeat domain-containing protein [uncultured Schumannella sp.]